MGATVKPLTQPARELRALLEQAHDRAVQGGVRHVSTKGNKEYYDAYHVVQDNVEAALAAVEAIRG